MWGRMAVAAGILLIQGLAAFLFIWGLKLHGRPLAAVVALFVIFSLPLPYILWLQAGARQPSWVLAGVVVRPAFAWYFNWLTFLVFLAPVVVIFRLFSYIPGWDILVTVLRWFILPVAVGWGMLTVGGLIGGLRPPRVETVEVRLPGLPAGEDGTRVVQLSDPHVGWWNAQAEIRRIGKIITELQPDLILLTGDLVDHNPNYVHALADCLPLTPRLGRLAIIGNHDVYTGEEAVTRRMEKRGFLMLRNRWTGLEEKGSRLVVAGVSDSGQEWTGYDGRAEQRLAEMIKDWPASRPIIILTHRPPREKILALLPPALVLSGHTHGGQLCFPFHGPGLADISFQHVAGLFQRGGTTLYVSRGTGTVGWPFRLFCPPEINLIILRSPEKAPR